MPYYRISLKNNRIRLFTKVCPQPKTTGPNVLHRKKKKKKNAACLIQEVKQLTDVIGYGRRVWIAAFQVLLVDLAHPLHAFVDALVVAVCAGLRTRSRLNQQNCVRHFLFFVGLVLRVSGLFDVKQYLFWKMDANKSQCSALLDWFAVKNRCYGHSPNSIDMNYFGYPVANLLKIIKIIRFVEQKEFRSLQCLLLASVSIHVMRRQARARSIVRQRNAMFGCRTVWIIRWMCCVTTSGCEWGNWANMLFKQLVGAIQLCWCFHTKLLWKNWVFCGFLSENVTFFEEYKNLGFLGVKLNC